MSIKDLFGKRSNQIVTQKDLEKINKDIESIEYAEQRVSDNMRFVPKTVIDFDDPKTFARYGSAEKYYKDAIGSVVNSYPYDGSNKEKLEWHNGATYIDNYIFENEYPRTTGYVTLNNSEFHPSAAWKSLDGRIYESALEPQYITLKGGAHPTPINASGEVGGEYTINMGGSIIWKQ